MVVTGLAPSVHTHINSAKLSSSDFRICARQLPAVQFASSSARRNITVCTSCEPQSKLFKGGYMRGYIRNYYRVAKGDTRTFDNG